MSRVDTEGHRGTHWKQLTQSHIQVDGSDGFTVPNLCIDEWGGDPPLPADGLQQRVEHS